MYLEKYIEDSDKEHIESSIRDNYTGISHLNTVERNGDNLIEANHHGITEETFVDFRNLLPAENCTAEIAHTAKKSLLIFLLPFLILFMVLYLGYKLYCLGIHIRDKNDLDESFDIARYSHSQLN